MSGQVPERSNRAVLKTVEGQPSVSSNLTPAVSERPEEPRFLVGANGPFVPSKRNPTGVRSIAGGSVAAVTVAGALLGLTTLLFAACPRARRLRMRRHARAARRRQPAEDVRAVAGALARHPGRLPRVRLPAVVGPGVARPKKPSVNGIAGIQWLVRLDMEHTSAAAAATDSLTATAKYSRFVSRGPVSVPHVAQDGQSLGSIHGFSVIVQSADPKANAQYQGAVAFQLARPTPLKPSARKKAPFVVVRFKLELPSSDRYVVGPGLVPSTWNLERTRAALAGVRLVGSMPPARMTVATRASRVSGAVVDRLGHSVGGALVTVYRVSRRCASRPSRRSRRSGACGRTRSAGTRSRSRQTFAQEAFASWRG